jgi:LytS/YehU family sensor histidine kinase
VSGQLELAELDESRHRLMRAEVRALRAQISPHFIYNSLGAIASFVRTDPERARELLVDLARWQVTAAEGDEPVTIWYLGNAGELAERAETITPPGGR